MACQNCVHYDLCSKYSSEDEINACTYCEDFQDKSKLIEPNCKVFQHDIERVYELKVRKIIYDCGHIAFDKESIGKTVFLTKEEAEQALKESIHYGL